MKFSRHQAIREVLLESEDGMTVQQVADKLNCGYKSIQKTMKLIWGVYIDRWAVPKRGQYAAVYMCVPVPDHAPHPTERYLPQTIWVKADASTSLTRLDQPLPNVSHVGKSIM